MQTMYLDNTRVMELCCSVRCQFAQYLAGLGRFLRHQCFRTPCRASIHDSVTCWPSSQRSVFYLVRMHSLAKTVNMYSAWTFRIDEPSKAPISAIPAVRSVVVGIVAACLRAAGFEQPIESSRSSNRGSAGFGSGRLRAGRHK